MPLRAHQPQQMIRVIDSHTGGEPTRIVVDGLPYLGTAEMSSRRELLRDEFDWLRRSLLTEPRGADWMVGAVLLDPVEPMSDAGVVFFNNVGYLGMCGHGLIGVVATLKYMGRALTKEVRIETPVGTVVARSLHGGRVAIDNVPSYRLRRAVPVDIPGYGTIVGDVAWGGNWFFLAHLDETTMHGSVDELTRLACQTRVALYEAGLVGENGAEIDHIEFFGQPSYADRANSRSFVLCPGGQYDRSPCGTGTSAKLACLAADGLLSPGEIWRQESFIGSIFEARYALSEKPGAVTPTIIGRAFVTGDMQLVIDPDDPFGFGIPGPGFVSGV
jgi:4-hydroxyproline epimerase